MQVFWVTDQDAPLPSGQVQEDAPATVDVEPPWHGLQGAKPLGPKNPAWHWQVPLAVGADPAGQTEAQVCPPTAQRPLGTFWQVPVLVDWSAHRLAAQSAPDEHG